MSQEKPEENCPNCSHNLLNDDGLVPAGDLIKCIECGEEWFPDVIQEFNMFKDYSLEDARKAHQGGLENLEEEDRDLEQLEVVEV